MLILIVSFCALPDTTKFNSGYGMVTYFIMVFLKTNSFPVVLFNYFLTDTTFYISQQKEKQNMSLLFDPTLIKQNLISDLCKTNLLYIFFHIQHRFVTGP